MMIRITKLKRFVNFLIQQQNFELLLWSLSLLLFSYTVVPTLYAGDSSELVQAAMQFGYAHPPGYPLYSLLGYVWSHFLLPFGDFAWRVHMFSVVWGSLGLVFFYKILRLLTIREVVAFATALTLAVSTSFWQFSIIAEVFSLHVFLSLLLIWAALSYWMTNDFRYTYVVSIAFSLQIAHQHMVVLLVPSLLLVIWFKKSWLFLTKKRLLLHTVILLSGFVWYVYLPVSYLLRGEYYWGDPSTLSGLLDILLRRQYGLLNLIPDGSQLTLAGRFTHFDIFARYITYNFGTLGGVLGVFGFMVLLWKKSQWGVFFLLALLWTGPLFFVLAGLPTDELFWLSMLEKFNMMPMVFVAVGLAFGLQYLWETLTELYQNFPFHPLTKNFLEIGMVILIFSIPGGLLNANWDVLNLREYKMAWYAGVDILNSPRPDSLVKLRGDTFGFNIGYLSQVEGIRKDDVIVATPPRGPYLDGLRHFGEQELGVVFPAAATEDEMIAILLTQYQGEVSFYVDQHVPQLQGRKLVHDGLLLRLVNTDDDFSDKDPYAALTSSLFLQHFNDDVSLPTYARDVNKSYAVLLTEIANYYFSEEKFLIAKDYYAAAIQVFSSLPEPYLGLSFVYMQDANCELIEQNLQSYLKYKSQPHQDSSYVVTFLQEQCML